MRDADFDSFLIDPYKKATYEDNKKQRYSIVEPEYEEGDPTWSVLCHYQEEEIEDGEVVLSGGTKTLGLFHSKQRAVDFIVKDRKARKIHL
jgi:hypothetical protein